MHNNLGLLIFLIKNKDDEEFYSVNLINTNIKIRSNDLIYGLLELNIVDNELLQVEANAAYAGYGPMLFISGLETLNRLGYECLWPDTDQTRAARKLWRSMRKKFTVCKNRGVRLNEPFPQYDTLIENGNNYYNHYISHGVTEDSFSKEILYRSAAFWMYMYEDSSWYKAELEANKILEEIYSVSPISLAHQKSY